MQLTNILRDLAEDYRRGRLYVPLADLGRFDIPSEHLFDAEYAGRLRGLVLWEAARAEGYFDAAEAEFPSGDGGRLFAACIMGGIYRRILERIKAARRHDRRIGLPAREKMALAAQIFRDYATSHD
jgi:phytoene synthase